jgi:hypothetical protein
LVTAGFLRVPPKINGRSGHRDSKNHSQIKPKNHNPNPKQRKNPLQIKQSFTIETQESQSKPNTNTKCKSNLRISLTPKKIKNKKSKIYPVVWKRVVSRRLEGGEKERGRENRPEYVGFGRGV